MSNNLFKQAVKILNDMTDKELEDFVQRNHPQGGVRVHWQVHPTTATSKEQVEQSIANVIKAFQEIPCQIMPEEDRFEAGRQDALADLERRVDRQIKFLNSIKDKDQVEGIALSLEHREGQRFMLDYIKKSIALDKRKLQDSRLQAAPAKVEPIGEDILPESLINAAGFQSVPQSSDTIMQAEADTIKLDGLKFKAIHDDTVFVVGHIEGNHYCVSHYDGRTSDSGKWKRGWQTKPYDEFTIRMNIRSGEWIPVLDAYDETNLRGELLKERLQAGPPEPQIDLMLELEREIKALNNFSFTGRMKKRHELLEKYHITRKP